MDVLYRCVVIACGLLLLVVNFINIARKKMDVGIGSSWTIMAMVVILFGIFFDFSVLRHIASILNIVLVYLFAAALVVALYIYGLRITELKKKNNEVAIWLSIMKSETEKTDEIVRERIMASEDFEEKENTYFGA